MKSTQMEAIASSLEAIASRLVAWCLSRQPLGLAIHEEILILQQLPVTLLGKRSPKHTGTLQFQLHIIIKRETQNRVCDFS